MTSLQKEIEATGLEIFRRMRGETPAAFSQKGVTGKLLHWAMQDEGLKVGLFRFVDVLPALRSFHEVSRHASEYLLPVASHLPLPARLAMKFAPVVPWVTSFAARQGVQRMARLFIAGENASQALPILRQMAEEGIGFTVDILGETVVSEKEAERYQKLYGAMIQQLSAQIDGWPRPSHLDQAPHAASPIVNVSIKISALYSQMKPTDPEGALAVLESRLVPLLILAKEAGAFINLDMEHSGLKTLTVELFKRLLEQEALRDFQQVGLALQAYHREAEADLRELLTWARARGRAMTIRLVKGAYWDYETILARQRSWPVPVFEKKAETDANYERLAGMLLANRDVVAAAFGTHSVRSIASCIVQAQQKGLAPADYEFQMLYGMAEPLKRALVKMGYRVRDYCPIGELLPAMGYLVRRLLENTSNEGFLRAAFSEGASPEELLRDPLEHLSGTPGSGRRAIPQGAGSRLAEQPRGAFFRRSDAAEPIFIFKNVPHTDFTLESNRDRMRRALEQVRTGLGRTWPLVIGGERVFTNETILSINPSRPGETIGKVASAGPTEGDRAVAEAAKAFPRWKDTPIEQRAAIWEKVADLLVAERFNFAALEILETGKTWLESDADVAEAIDFCRFYAGQMRGLGGREYPVPGERNFHHYVPRGLAVVIAPWNFPLAILSGMVAAASVAGNCVIMKPSGESAVIGAWFMEVLERAGMPPGAVNFLPGPGRTLGEQLVKDPRVALIAFTGSREVGLRIQALAGQTDPKQWQLKKVICEMGGKNAMIVDADADLDEAIPAIIYSAFGYQGQKCSALSRLILLESNHDRVVERLIEAARSLRVGAPEDPGVSMGPLIDDSARRRLEEYQRLGEEKARLAFLGTVPDLPGFFVAPAIFTAVPPDSRLAQEEIFGPFLSIIKASNLDEAIAIGNATAYGLTGGIFSRSPANIRKAAERLEVGNFYINRTITGALVGRQPFGGFKMSGGGTKAGGDDYLLHFLFPRVITENLLRHGFAGEQPDGE